MNLRKFKYIAAAALTTLGTNASILSFAYADEGDIVLNEIDFGTVTAGYTSSEITITASNNMDKKQNIVSLSLEDGTAFTIPECTLPTELKKNATNKDLNCKVALTVGLPADEYTDKLTLVTTDPNGKESTITTANVKAVVAPKEKVDLNPIVTINGKVYDGEPADAPTISETAGTVTIKYTNDTYNSTIAPTNAGTYSVTIHMTGNDDYKPFYKVYADALVIEKANINPSIDFEDKVYDGEATTTPTIKGGFGNVTVKYSKDGVDSYEAPVNAGIYSVTVHMTGDENHKGFYNIYKDAFEIKKAENTPVVSFEDKYYDGEPITTPTIEGGYGKLTVKYVKDGEGFYDAPVEVGTYDVIVHMAGDENHKGFYQVYKEAFSILAVPEEEPEEETPSVPTTPNTGAVTAAEGANSSALASAIISVFAVFGFAVKRSNR